MHICYYQLLFLYFGAMLLLVGPPAGFITMQHALVNKHGLFTSNATTSATSTTTSPSSHDDGEASKQFAAACNLALSAMNLCALLAGVCVDVLGGWAQGVVFSILWTVGISVSGVSDTLFVLGVTTASIAAQFVFTSIVFFHVRHASVKARYAMHIAALTVVRNFSTIITVPLAKLVDAFPSDQLWKPFLIYGLAVGIPCTACFFFMFPKRLRINIHDCGSAEHLQLIAEQPSLDTFSGVAHFEEDETTTTDGSNTVRRALMAVGASNETFKLVAKRAPVLLVLCLLRAIFLVTLSYFLTVELAFVGGQVFAGDTSSVENLLTSFNYLMSGLAVFALVPGQLVRRFDAAGLGGWGFVSTALVVTFGALLLAFLPSGDGAPFTVAYVVYSIVIVWRVTGFAVVNLSATTLLLPPGSTRGASVFGLLYTVGGGVSLAIGGVLTRTVTDKEQFRTVIIVLCGGATLLECVLSLAVLRSRPSADADEEEGKYVEVNDSQ